MNAGDPEPEQASDFKGNQELKDSNGEFGGGRWETVGGSEAWGGRRMVS